MVRSAINWKKGLLRLWLLPSCLIWLACAVALPLAVLDYRDASAAIVKYTAEISADLVAQGLAPVPPGFLLDLPYNSDLLRSQRRAMQELNLVGMGAVAPIIVFLLAMSIWASVRWVFRGFYGEPSREKL
mgnify:CR=1 FL=1